MAYEKMQGDIKNFAIFGNYIYTNPAFILEAHNKKQSKKALCAIDKYKDKYYFVGYIKYEFYKYLFDKKYSSKEPFLYFAAYKNRQKFQKQDSKFDFCPIFKKDLEKESYFQKLSSIKDSIAKGQCYQVNLTEELRFTSNLDGYHIFNTLYNRQNTKYKAFIKTNNLEIISFSPETFFKVKNRKITTLPMKGTIKRGKTKKEDLKLKKFLQKDTKTISENVMIVDLLRNDISKIIIKNSMKVKLFQIKSYPTLHQMVSKIDGKLKKNASLYKIIQALFPCGSITGAPKIETIKVINQLEKRDRGIYCGSIGMIHKNSMNLSVAIRTIEKNRKENIYRYGVGSGIVWDSEAQLEFDELKLKSKIIRNDFYIFETMYQKNGKILFLQEHIKRLIDSGKFFGFDITKISNDLRDTISTKKRTEKLFNDIYKFNDFIFNTQYFFYDIDIAQKNKNVVRLKLYQNGTYEFEYLDLKPSNSDKLLIYKQNIETNMLLNHKTSLRKHYKKHEKLWQDNSCYDIIFFDKEGNLTEGTRTNIVIKTNDKLLTPYAKNILNGIYRQKLLEYGLIQECHISKEQLLNSKEIFAINSLRGIKRVFI